MVSNPSRANAGDYITGGPFGVGTQITNIDGSTLTINTPAQTVRGTARDARGRRIDVTEFEPPFAVKLVRNDTSANPLLPDCCNGVQSNQYTFLVTEGKSASGFYSQPVRAWVDTSPLVNYGDRKGLRWTEVDEVLLIKLMLSILMKESWVINFPVILLKKLLTGLSEIAQEQDIWNYQALFFMEMNINGVI